jgi:CxxC motif-containing protein (DUF1111 family)
MKPFWKTQAAVCLAVAILTFNCMPAMYAQTTTPGSDPGVQAPPPVPSSFVTCFSSSIPQPDRGIDSGQFGVNPNGLPSTSALFPVPLQGMFTTANGQNGLNQLDLFCAAAGRFQEIDSVSGVLNPAPTGNCTPVDLNYSGSSGTIPCVESGSGLGPRFNGNSCIMCHFTPTYLGAGAQNTSATLNAEATAVANVFVTNSGGVGNQDGGTNSLAAFQNFGSSGVTLIGPNTPNREVRFIENLNTGQNDFNVHQLFTITGRVDATNAININPGIGTGSNNLTTCAEGQPNFSANLSATNPNVNSGTLNTGNVIFRIPITTLGDGLVELIDDEQLELNLAANQIDNVTGTFNRSGNDATITRFGWKAQNKSLLMFSGEAYNVEVGVSNDLFPNERRIDDDLLDESLTTIEDCQFNPLPDDTINFFSSSSNSGTAVEGNLASQISSDITNFAIAMRLSEPPIRNTSGNTGFSASDLSTGEQAFITVGCTHCHTDVNGNGSTNHMVTIGTSSVPVGQGDQAVNAFSDFAIHTLSDAPGTNSYNVPCINDQITQGSATGGIFRSAPLWGLSTRKFLLHDGSETDLVRVIKRHACTGSEANTVVGNFFTSANQTQLLEFLRTL